MSMKACAAHNFIKSQHSMGKQRRAVSDKVILHSVITNVVNNLGVTVTLTFIYHSMYQQATTLCKAYYPTVIDVTSTAVDSVIEKN